MRSMFGMRSDVPYRSSQLRPVCGDGDVTGCPSWSDRKRVRLPASPGWNQTSFKLASVCPDINIQILFFTTDMDLQRKTKLQQKCRQ